MKIEDIATGRNLRTFNGYDKNRTLGFQGFRVQSEKASGKQTAW